MTTKTAHRRAVATLKRWANYEADTRVEPGDNWYEIRLYRIRRATHWPVIPSWINVATIDLRDLIPPDNQISEKGRRVIYIKLDTKREKK